MNSWDSCALSLMADTRSFLLTMGPWAAAPATPRRTSSAIPLNCMVICQHQHLQQGEEGSSGWLLTRHDT